MCRVPLNTLSLRTGCSGETLRAIRDKPYLVVASDEGLSGSYWSRAVHLQVRVVILRHKYLKDVQHLEKEIETAETVRQETQRGREGLRSGLSLKGLVQINITWTEIPTGRVSGSL